MGGIPVSGGEDEAVGTELGSAIQGDRNVGGGLRVQDDRVGISCPSFRKRGTAGLNDRYSCGVIVGDAGSDRTDRKSVVIAIATGGGVLNRAAVIAFSDTVIDRCNSDRLSHIPVCRCKS